jgi:hypothetical protein
MTRPDYQMISHRAALVIAYCDCEVRIGVIRDRNGRSAPRPLSNGGLNRSIATLHLFLYDKVLRRPVETTVKSAILTVGRSLPVCPDQRTFAGCVGMSQRCHERTMP